MENSELEHTALQLLKKLDIEIDSSNIEDCQWLPSKGPKKFLVKFSKGKDANRIRKVKKNMKGMDLSSIGIRSPVYINRAHRNRGSREAMAPSTFLLSNVFFLFFF